jgi:hypothetical protein
MISIWLELSLSTFENSSLHARDRFAALFSIKPRSTARFLSLLSPSSNSDLLMSPLPSRSSCLKILMIRIGSIAATAPCVLPSNTDALFDFETACAPILLLIGRAPPELFPDSCLVDFLIPVRRFVRFADWYQLSNRPFPSYSRFSVTFDAKCRDSFVERLASLSMTALFL